MTPLVGGIVIVCILLQLLIVLLAQYKIRCLEKQRDFFLSATISLMPYRFQHRPVEDHHAFLDFKETVQCSDDEARMLVGFLATNHPKLLVTTDHYVTTNELRDDPPAR